MNRIVGRALLILAGFVFTGSVFMDWVGEYPTHVSGIEHLYGKVGLIGALLALAAATYAIVRGEEAANGWRRGAVIGGLLALYPAGWALINPTEFLYEVLANPEIDYALPKVGLYVALVAAIGLTAIPIITSFFEQSGERTGTVSSRSNAAGRIDQEESRTIADNAEASVDQQGEQRTSQSSSFLWYKTFAIFGAVVQVTNLLDIHYGLVFYAIGGIFYYYTIFSDTITCLAASYGAFLSSKGDGRWVFPMSIIALFFNPVYPLYTFVVNHMTVWVWSVVFPAVAGVFLLSVFAEQRIQVAKRTE